jgi:hypothetical protein
MTRRIGVVERHGEIRLKCGESGAAPMDASPFFPRRSACPAAPVPWGFLGFLPILTGPTTTNLEKTYKLLQ